MDNVVRYFSSKSLRTNVKIMRCLFKCQTKYVYTHLKAILQSILRLERLQYTFIPGRLTVIKIFGELLLQCP